jgi:two-component system, NarL family, response regulator NreC
MTRIRILIAEDHETVREGLKLILNAQPDIEVICDVGDGQTAVARAQELLPDIVLMDLSMPRLNGLKATEKLGQCCPQVKVLALTRHSEDGYLQQLLRVGAAGYVLKQSPPAELLHAIRSIAAGGKYLDPAVAGKVMGRYAAKRSFSTRGDPKENLSDREAEVLRMIAWGHSNKEIAAQLELSIKTIEVHKANAMKKLGMGSRIDIVRYALLQGWLEET